MKIVVFLLIGVFFSAFNAFGDDYISNLRCKSGLISTGASALEIASKCGQPDSKATVERRAPWSRGEYKIIEEWTYNLGPNDYIHVLEVEGSTLKAIRRGARGF